jgi:hypothetical protein
MRGSISLDGGGLCGNLSVPPAPMTALLVRARGDGSISDRGGPGARCATRSAHFLRLWIEADRARAARPDQPLFFVSGRRSPCRTRSRRQQSRCERPNGSSQSRCSWLASSSFAYTSPSRCPRRSPHRPIRLPRRASKIRSLRWRPTASIEIPAGRAAASDGVTPEHDPRGSGLFASRREQRSPETGRRQVRGEAGDLEPDRHLRARRLQDMLIAWRMSSFFTGLLPVGKNLSLAI